MVGWNAAGSNTLDYVIDDGWKTATENLGKTSFGTSAQVIGKASVIYIYI